MHNTIKCRDEKHCILSILVFLKCKLLSKESINIGLSNLYIHAYKKKWVKDLFVS